MSQHTNAVKISLAGVRTPTIDTTPPKVTKVEASPEHGQLDSGQTELIKLDFSESVQVKGTPELLLNDGGVAIYDAAQSAVLVNPENVFEIMRALLRVLRDQPLRDRMKQRGYEQAARFSWETSVRRILDAYGQIAHGRTSPGQAPAAD